ncbi:MAG: HD domain-containing protein [Bacteroidales bacterium]|nr:HD domain-containing protein [Bacteroidales bacterium]
MPFFITKMDVLQDILQTEQKWKTQLILHVRNIFKNTWLPSHDERHSIRVWEFAKTLLIELEKNHIFYSFEEIEELIIASFFHDSGMSLTLEPEHGKYSRQICNTFLSEKTVISSDRKHKILDAIELHDDKSYRKETFLNPKGILALLCIADDMDAFGRIGIYRFWEINVLRNIPINKMSSKIINSLESRMNYFSSIFPFRNNYYDLQNERNKITQDFFKHLEKEIQSISQLDETSYALKVIDYFNNLIFKQEIHPEQIFSIIKHKESNQNVINFFNAFNHELSEFQGQKE